MRDHKPEPFGLMGGVRCMGCDETWPCEVSRLRAALENARRDLFSVAPKRGSRSPIRKVVDVAVKRIEDALAPYEN